MLKYIESIFCYINRQCSEDNVTHYEMLSLSKIVLIVLIPFSYKESYLLFSRITFTNTLVIISYLQLYHFEASWWSCTLNPKTISVHNY